jgi:hypothetical protein
MMYLYRVPLEDGEPVYQIPRGTRVNESWKAEGDYYVITGDRVGQWERDEVAVDSIEVTREEVDEMAETAC